MPSLEEIIHREVESLPSQLARLYSNYALRSSDRPGMPGWNEDEANLRQADGYRLASLGFSLLAEGDRRASAALRRAAEIFEWLSTGEDGDDGTIFSILLYQIAGYPAVARSLSAISSDDSLIAKLSRGEYSTSEAQLIEACGILGSDPKAFQTDSDEYVEFERIFISSAAVLVSYMRWGDMRIEHALAALDDVARYFMLGSDDASWLLARAFATMARRCVESSLRKACEDLIPQLSPAGRRAIERYIRDAYISQKAVAWQSQISGIGALVQNSDFAMCTPTGSGKTTVAEIAIIQALFSGSDSFFAEAGIGQLVIYIVPSRALAREVERRLRLSFADDEAFPVQVVSSYGGADFSPADSWLDSQRGTVIVCTQEKADSLIRSAGGTFLRKLKLMIVDEAHSVLATDSNWERALRLESLIARLRNLSAGTHCRVIALSAVLGDTTGLARWINPDEQREVLADYRSTRQAFGRLTMAASGQLDVQYDMLNGVPLGNAEKFRPNLRQFVPDFPHLADRFSKGPEVQLRALALWVAAHLASLARQESGMVLITVGSHINNYAKDFIGLLDSWSDLPQFFDRERASVDSAYRDAVDSCADYFGIDSYEYRLLERGIVVHHGKLPSRMANAFTRLIESKLARIVVATSTLSEGVNLPFETILFPSLRRGAGIMSAEYIRNVVGRAGRPGVAREGRALVLLGTGKIFKNAARSYREVVDSLSGALAAGKPKSALQVLFNKIYDEWKQVSVDQDFEAFLSWLESTPISEPPSGPLSVDMDCVDQFIISAMAELNGADGIAISTAEAEQRLQNLWRKTFCYAIDAQSKVIDALEARSRHIRREAGDDAELRRIYRTSLGPRSAIKLFEQLEKIRALFDRAYAYTRWNSDVRVAFLSELLEVVDTVPDFSFTAQFENGPHWQDVLLWWLRQGAILPPPDKIGSWYSLANQAFAYQGTWAVGSAMISMMREDITLDLPIAERLHDSGIPWLALWLRDMLALGCLDPVQAYIFGNGYARSRADALSHSGEYYSSCTTVDDSVLDLKSIARWIGERFSRIGNTAEASTTRFYDIKTIATLASESTALHVWPQVLQSDVLWRDASGFPVASSAADDKFDLSWDYMLNVPSGIVTGTPHAAASDSGA